MKKYISILLILIYCLPIFAHSGKINHHIIIDTDCAADDLRAICLLLSSSDIRTIAITTSDGALSPEMGLKKVRSLLKSLGHEGISTTSGINTQLNTPQWRDLSQNIIWGEEIVDNTIVNEPASDLIINSIYNEEEPVTIVCLGSLTNIKNAIVSNPKIQARIDRIIWYNNSIHTNEGTNYDIDREAADYILNAEIKIDVVSSPQESEINFTKDLLQSIQSIPNSYSQKIAETHSQNDAYKMIDSKHFKLWDDLTVLYLLYPELFKTELFEEFPKHTLNSIITNIGIGEKILEILSDKDDDLGIVFEHFPDNQNFYRDDVKQLMDQIISKHGKEEWRLIVLTNEFHDHLGIYSIVGAKMGLRAREYFNIDRDEMSVVSYAGNRPPISCLNDGLQVSTGATLGQGTILTMTDDLQQKPKAIFTHNNSTISIELKPEYWQIVRNDIKKGIEVHGALTNNYWFFVRELAIKYWLDWNRREIFNIEISEY